MRDDKVIIPISVAGGGAELHLSCEHAGGEIISKGDAEENGEAAFQIKEGCFYEYKVVPEEYCLEVSEVVSRSRYYPFAGRISPNIYVGTLKIGVLKFASGERCGEVALEVQSVKTNYREEYREMLKEITEKCTELLMQYSSPVSQHFEVDFNADAQTLYQRFAFVKSILESEEFNDAVHKVVMSPVTKWKGSEAIKDIRGVRRFSGSAIRQLAGAGNRLDIPFTHPLKKQFETIPSRIRVSNKTETADTPENRFVKHALLSFQSLCRDFETSIKGGSRASKEASLITKKLEQHLGHGLFKDISDLTAIPLNSPILQRKEGYREVLRAWLMFDLAAKMVWKGGEDVYGANKRDVAVLYEYWLFFKLLDIVKEVFEIESLPADALIEKDAGGVGLKLKQGKYLPVKGVYVSDTRRLNIEFSYNKTFSGGKGYPKGGSWSRSLRPDYTLSVWPFGIEQEEAEQEELIVHIHFDAKYKAEDIGAILGDSESLDEEKQDQKKGTYKRADILKMHTYRDAIRRTAGAYVLYPGDKSEKKHGFHEILPGLGAFAIRPSKSDNGIEALKVFLREVVAHFMNRASQREKMSYKTYEAHKNRTPNQLNESLPETYGKNRGLIPDETYVLVAFYKNEEQLNWVIKNKLYNVRSGPGNGSHRLTPKTSSAHYVLLHSEASPVTGQILKISEKGPRIFSKEQLVKKGYPSPSQEFYLVYDVEPVGVEDFEDMKWDVRGLPGYTGSRGSAYPFAVSLTELMKGLVR